MTHSPAPRPVFARRPLPPRRVPRRRYLIAVGAGALALIVALAIAWQLAALNARTRSAPEGGRGGPTTLAVLPFSSPGAGRAYLGKGFAEDIASALARYSGLAVIATHSSFRYADEPNPARAGRALGARYVLTGSVAHGTATAHIRATLIDTTDGARVWSERIDWPATGFFEAQFGIADRVAGRLAAGSDRAGPGDGRRMPHANLPAYDRYLLARELLRRRGESDRPGAAVLAARHLLERAVAADPGFAPYYALLSETHRAAYAEPMRHPALDPERGSRSAIEFAHQLASRAAALDGNSAAVWTQLGWVLHWRGLPDEAIAAFERARALDPSVVDARAGEPLIRVGRAVEAVPIIERALRLDPFAAPETLASLGHAYYLLGDSGKAAEALAACVQRAPGFAFCHRLLAAAFAETGRQAEAARHAREAMRENPRWTIAADARAGVYRRSEDRQRVVAGYRKAGLPE